MRLAFVQKTLMLVQPATALQQTPAKHQLCLQSRFRGKQRKSLALSQKLMNRQPRRPSLRSKGSSRRQQRVQRRQPPWT